MKRLVVSMVVVALLGVSGTARGSRSRRPAHKEIPISTLYEYQEKYSVVLSIPSGKKYCSGGIVEDKIITAAHCCAPMVWANTVKGFSWSVDGVHMEAIKGFETDPNGQDVCVILPVTRVHSPIKPGPVPRADVDRNIAEKVFFVINKITSIYSDPSLKAMEVQRVYRIGVWEDDTQYVVMQGEAIPGTSGSLILDSQGHYVGNLVVSLDSDDGEAIPHVFGMSLWELTAWGNPQRGE